MKWLTASRWPNAPRRVPRPLPVGDGRLRAAGRGVVMGQQFRLRLDGSGNWASKHLRNLLVILLPGALEQRLIGGILDQRVLEAIRRLRREAPLVEQFRVHQLSPARAATLASSSGDTAWSTS